MKNKQTYKSEVDRISYRKVHWFIRKWYACSDRLRLSLITLPLLVSISFHLAMLVATLLIVLWIVVRKMHWDKRCELKEVLTKYKTLKTKVALSPSERVDLEERTKAVNSELLTL